MFCVFTQAIGSCLGRFRNKAEENGDRMPMARKRGADFDSYGGGAAKRGRFDDKRGSGAGGGRGGRGGGKKRLFENLND